MVVGSFEPPAPGPNVDLADQWFAYEHYPQVYAAKIALTVITMLLVLPGYRTFRLRISPLAIVVGVLGVVAWITLCELQLEHRFFAWLGVDVIPGLGARSAFNPLEQMADRNWAYGFLAVRFIGLALVVPVIEEFFLRGWLVRYLISAEWWTVPFGVATRSGLIAATAVPMLMHPGELLAAAVWFSAVTWLMLRTHNIWDCVAAHAITNLLLGLYVLYSGHWFMM
jgi:hypothetical protein